MLHNLRVSEEGKSKPLIHMLVEHVSDDETLGLLRKCLELGFNSNIQNSTNETALHIVCKSQTTLCCSIT